MLFRIWLKTEKKMVYSKYPYSLDYSEERGFLLYEAEGYVVKSFDAKGIIVMPKIGKRDANKKEIYQHDILEYDNLLLGVVDYCDKRIGWALKSYDVKKNVFYSCNCYHCDKNFDITDYEKLIVVGNIYENPELLW